LFILRTMKNLITPFEKISNRSSWLISIFWLALTIGAWGIYSLKEVRMFPSIGQVLEGFVGLWNEGLVTHIFSSLSLCGMSVFVAVIVSLIFVYLSPLPLIKPLTTAVSKFRFLPLTGIAFYITMIVSSGREIQMWILVIFMTTYLVTTLLSMLKDIPEVEFDHARALGCSRWVVLLEVVIKGRFDYVLDMVRQNIAIVWMFLVTVESLLAASGGLGFLIKNSDKFMNHGRIVALQLVILLIGLGLDYIVNTIRRKSFRYSKL